MSLQAEVGLRLGTLDLDLELKLTAREVVAVVGPNGAGKTTLLQALSGLVPLSRGRVILGGRLLEDPERGIRLAPERRAVGLVFQDYLLFPHLSVIDNVAFGLRAKGVRRREARIRAQAWLERMGLAQAAGAKPSALSGGQAQRIGLARALAAEPRLLLLDEPLAALDVESRLDVRRELRTHLEAFTGPCALVTHDPVEAVALADRLIVLEEGRIVQQGTVQQVARRPRSEWVARLVGLNLYQGRARRGEVSLPSANLLSSTAESGEVFAIVHPQAVALYREPPGGSPRNVWPGVVEGLDVHGSHVRVHVGGLLPIVAEVTPAAAAELELGRGGTVWVSVKATEVQLYAK